MKVLARIVLFSLWLIKMARGKSRESKVFTSFKGSIGRKKTEIQWHFGGLQKFIMA